jgi:hypothetical protein
MAEKTVIFLILGSDIYIAGIQWLWLVSHPHSVLLLHDFWKGMYTYYSCLTKYYVVSGLMQGPLKRYLICFFSYIF